MGGSFHAARVQDRRVVAGVGWWTALAGLVLAGCAVVLGAETAAASAACATSSKPDMASARELAKSIVDELSR